MKPYLFFSRIFFSYFILLVLTADMYGSHDLLLSSQQEIIRINEIKLKSEQILNRLKRAKGILPTEAPFIKIEKPTGHSIAAAYLDEEIIRLDPEAYDICEGMGEKNPGDLENALAYILGHELSHYILSHEKENELINESVLSVENRLNSESERVFAMKGSNNQMVTDALGDFHRAQDEAEADLEGAILGYLAGYQTTEAGKKFLKIAYKELEINEKSAKYPSLNQRLELIEGTSNELKKLVPLFEMANYLVAIEQYEDAIPYLERILPKFQSREIYNNIGVMYLLETLRLFEEPLTDYQMPLTLDSEFRAPHPIAGKPRESFAGPVINGWVRREHCFLNEGQKQIEKSKEYFQKALNLDSDYAIAQLNISIAETFIYLIFGDDPDPLLMYPCRTRKKEELIKAQSSVYKARTMLRDQMTLDTIEYYAYTEEEAHQLINSNPEKFINNERSISPEGDAIVDNQIFQNGQTGTRENWDWDSLVAPFKFEYVNFNEGYRLNQEYRSPSYTTSQNAKKTGADERRLLLSNIWIQIEILNILAGEMENGKIEMEDLYVRGDSTAMVELPPFFRALELAPNNRLAQYNKQVALGLETDRVSDNTATGSVCEFMLPNLDKDINEIYESIEDWQEYRLEKSKLVFYYSLDFRMMNHKDFIQTMKYSKYKNHHIYANVSSMNIDRRVEKSIVLAPEMDSIDSSNCGIRKSDDLKKVEELHGPPTRTITMSGGNYIVYDLISNPLPSAISETNSVPLRIIKNTKGIIFKLDYDNKVKGWAYFERHIQTDKTFN